MRFKHFLEQFGVDPTKTTLFTPTPDISYGDLNQTRTYAPNKTQKMQGFGNNALGGKMANLLKALKVLDPFVDNRRNGSIVGTPSFMSPEQTVQSKNHDSDNILDFYLTTKRTYPQIANMFYPLVNMYKQFSNGISGIIDSFNSGFTTENSELAHRLDLRNIQNLKKGVEQVKIALSQFQQAENQQLGPQFQQSIGLFNKFYTSFNTIIPQIEPHFNNAYSQVSKQAWDYTKGQ